MLMYPSGQRRIRIFKSNNLTGDSLESRYRLNAKLKVSIKQISPQSKSSYADGVRFRGIPLNLFFLFTFLFWLPAQKLELR